MKIPICLSVWDQNQHAVSSDAASFLTGKLCAEDWRGKWIGPELATACATLGFAAEAGSAVEERWVRVDFGREDFGWAKKQLTNGLTRCGPDGTGIPEHQHGAIYLRKTFDLDQPAVRAVLFFSGLGFSEVAIVHRKVGDYLIGPGFTDYDHRVPYMIAPEATRPKIESALRLPVPSRISRKQQITHKSHERT